MVYSLEVDFFPFLVLYVLSLVHGSFPFWTLLCGVYRLYGLIFFANFNRSVTAICLATLFLNVPVSYERDIKDCVIFECCAAPGEAFNVLWYVLQIAHATLLTA